ncbi:hypothetical protein AG1IA_05362 [Rhizoctonia solani AG-1 IA]|uniref:VASt domain-containing protein n=1 Tax=Thanatephorus cucumeris (strain AG1-IA) TaxID=983506 RepID=L8WR39_THACA|nr:hypothetical protein AG1IA_05362 [Rhizoctonia solani AG-1 IA]
MRVGSEIARWRASPTYPGPHPPAGYQISPQMLRYQCNTGCWIGDDQYGLVAARPSSCFGLTDTSKLFGQHPLAYTYDGTAQYDPRSCVCGNDPQHYPNIIADAVLPAHPGTIFNLMYSYHDEIKDFWARQGMHDLRTIGWVPQDPSYSNSRLRTRTMLFSVDIPEGLQLNHNVTRIQVTDTITHLRDCPFSSSVLSTIYAPDVASGHAFAVKTRTCIIPHAKSEARLFVTAVLVWGDGSPIGQAALVGLRQYHDNILSVMREEISTNKEVYASLDEAAIIECRNKFKYIG